MHSKNTAFTLIELAIVLVILGFVGTILVPPIVTSIRHEKRQENKDALIALRHALVGYVREQKSLPASLADAGLPTQDTWTREYIYKPGFGENIDICDVTSGNLTVQLDTGPSISPAFLIASRGADTTINAKYDANPIDISNPEDDIIEYMSLNHLKYLVCE